MKRARRACTRLIPVLLLFLVWGLASGIEVACAAFDDARLPDARDGGTGSTDSSTDTGTATTSCPVIQIPTDPPPPSGSSGTDVEIVLTVRDLTLGISDAGTLDPTFGYDLDNTCTCNPDRGSCIARTDAGAPDKNDPNCDGELGRDDGTGRLLASLSSFTKGDPAQYANEAINEGSRGILLRITGYNGTPSDNDVGVAVYRSPGTLDADQKIHVPTFASDEEWSVDKEDILLNQEPTWGAKHSSQGFVADSMLVVRLDSSVFPFNVDSDILLKEVAITGKLTKSAATNNLWELDNITAVGRWPIADALRTVVKVQDPTDATKRLCQRAALIPSLRTTICNGTDIMEQRQSDGKNQPCNALSTAVRFRATEAKLGIIIEPKRIDPCAGIDIGSCQ